MRERMNDCVDCEYCVNCGRKDYYSVVYCDHCGEEIESSYRWKGEEYCLECIALLIVRAHIDGNATEKNYRKKIEEYFCKHITDSESWLPSTENIDLLTHFSEFSELEFEDVHFLCFYFKEEFPVYIEDPFA